MANNHKQPSIAIEVAYADTTEQAIIALQVAAGTTVQQAIISSGILQRFTNITLATIAVGIFARQVSLATVLQHGDRVEIYRPLLVDPKTARRQRAGGLTA